MTQTRSYSAGLLPLPSPIISSKDHGSAIDTNDDAVTNSSQRSHRKSTSLALPPSRSPSRRREYIDELLGKDLSEYRGKDRLYDYSKILQFVGREQRDEIIKLEAAVAANLAPSPSGGSTRRATDQSDLSTKRNAQLDPTRKGIAVVFNPTIPELDILQRNVMDDSKYIKAKLPSFHWWNDTLHIYFDKARENNAAANGRPEVVILTKKLDDCAAQDRTFIHTIKLGKLGWGIRARRMTRRLRVIYVETPQYHQAKFNEKSSSKVCEVAVGEFC